MKAPVVANTKSARPVRGMPPREHFGSGANFVQQMQAVRVRQFEYKLRLASDVVRNLCHSDFRCWRRKGKTNAKIQT